MTIPLIVLAGCAVLVGLVFGVPTGHSLFEHHLEHTLGLRGAGARRARARLRLGDGDRRHAGRRASGIGLSYAAVRPAEPGPGAAGQAARAALPGVAATSSTSTRSTSGSSIRPTLDAGGRAATFLDEYLVRRPGAGVAAWVPRMFGREVLAPFQNGLIQFYAAVTAAGRGGAALDLVADAELDRDAERFASESAMRTR